MRRESRVDEWAQHDLARKGNLFDGGRLANVVSPAAMDKPLEEKKINYINHSIYYY